MKPHPDKDGYLTVQLCKKGKIKMKRVHQLVAEAFLPNPLGKKLVNHDDGNKANNNVGNLEWSTHQENEDHAARNGLKASGKNRNHGIAKLTMEKVKVIKDRLKKIRPRGSHKFFPDGDCIEKIAADYGVSMVTIYNIQHGRIWKDS
jgi:hypothetical protein